MTFATRLLVSTGAAAFVLLPPVETVITSSPNGGWPSYQQAFRIGSTVYFGWVDSSGNVEVTTHNDTTGITASPSTLKAAMEADWHDSPALARLSNGKIIAAYCLHSGSQMYVRVSTSADDVTAWGSEANIDAQLGGFQYTYPVLFVDPSGKVWIFYRNDGPGSNGEPSKWSYSTSTNDGVTWATATEFFIGANATRLSYMRVDFDGVSRFDFAVTDGSPDADNASMYHFSMSTAGVFSKSDGTSVPGVVPFDETDVTLVHSGGTGGARYAAGMVGNGGFPVITWPEWAGGGVKDYYYARWTGSAWDVHNVVSDGVTGAPWAEGGCVPEYENPSVLWLSRSIGGTYDVHRYLTSDGGATWGSEQISSSPSDDFYPIAVRYADRLRSLWLRGTATDSDNFTLSVMGARQ